MAQSINLIPQQEKQEQTKTALLKASTVFTIILLIIVAGVSAYYYFENKKYVDRLEEVNSEIDKYRSEVKSLTAVEVNARNLDKKYSILSELFNTRYTFSSLLREFEKRQPVGVVISSFDVREGTINISGFTTSYISVADFVNRLLGDAPGITFLEDGTKNPLAKLFTAVKLNSVSLDSGNNEVNYSLTVSFDPTLLQK